VTFAVSVTAPTQEIDALIARVERLQGIVAKYADLIVQEAKRLSPVDTGALRASITAHLDGLMAEITAGEGLPDIRAVVMEYGSSRVAARSYLRPAMERYAPDFIREIQAALGG
jgi:hypothetical protein